MLTTRLCIPPTRPELVVRSRLTDRLNAGLGQGNCFARKLTLVCAPAGFGKTTLVCEWLNGLDHPHSWLSLDEGDNEPFRFFTYLLAALQKVDFRISQAAEAMLQASQPPIRGGEGIPQSPRGTVRHPQRVQ